MTTDGLPTNGATREHLSGEQLNRYVDGDLSVDERRSADLHLSACDRCAEELADLTTISTVLRSLPLARVPRSFQLDASYARSSTPFWQRFGAMLLPALPAMRAGTIALALAFSAVTAYRVVDDGAQREDSGMIAQPITSPAAPTATLVAAGRAVETVEIVIEETAIESEAGGDTEISASADVFAEDDASSGADADLAQPESDDGAIDEALAGEEPSDEPMEMFEAPESAESEEASLESDATGLEIAQSAPVEASPTADPTLTATQIAQPTATGTATAVPAALPTSLPAPVAEEGGDDRSWLGRAQLVLGVMLALLGGLVVGVQRLRRKVTG